MGVTTVPDDVTPFAVLDDGTRDGARVGRVLGTYLHGAFEDPAICEDVFGVAPAPEPSEADRYAALARWLDAYAEHAEAWLLDGGPA
jgi:cobyric acid synthase